MLSHISNSILSPRQLKLTRINTPEQQAVTKNNIHVNLVKVLATATGSFTCWRIGYGSKQSKVDWQLACRDKFGVG